MQHLFIFSPGRWVGGGKITFNTSPELIRFYTSWNVEEKKNGVIECTQQIEMQTLHENVRNQFSIHDISPGILMTRFKIDLENELIGSAKGVGIVDTKTIAWEFRGNKGIEGFEVYEIQENGDYMLHAEYSSVDDFRTIVDGRIWSKSPSNPA